MFKKSISIIFIILLVLLMNIIIFAQDSDEIEYVSIINPEVGGSGKVISEDSLFISIFVIEDVDLLLELVKIDTPVFNFETEEVVPLIEPINNNEANEEETEENIDEEKVIFGEDSGILEELDTQLKKEDIFTAYQNAQEIFDITEALYLEAMLNISGIPNLVDESAINYDPTYELTEEEVLYLEEADTAYIAYSYAISDYNYWEEEYLKLFEKVIFSNVEMNVDPLLPYFEYTVKDIKSGTYKLAIRLKETNKVVKLLEFEVVTGEVLAEEIVEEMLKSIDFFDNIVDFEMIE